MNVYQVEDIVLWGIREEKLLVNLSGNYEYSSMLVKTRRTMILGLTMYQILMPTVFKKTP